MKIENVPFMTTDWNKIQSSAHKGETGMAYWRTLDVGNVRVRMVEYTPGYVADHWCSRGHVLLVMDGELITELKDGRKFKMGPGMSYQVASNAEPHRSSTNAGGQTFYRRLKSLDWSFLTKGKSHLDNPKSTPGLFL